MAAFPLLSKHLNKEEAVLLLVDHRPLVGLEHIHPVGRNPAVHSLVELDCFQVDYTFVALFSVSLLRCDDIFCDLFSQCNNTAVAVVQ